jgi:hypothetical protein
MAVSDASKAVTRLLQDPDLLIELEQAKTASARHKIMQRVDLPTDLKPPEIAAAVMTTFGLITSGLTGDRSNAVVTGLVQAWRPGDDFSNVDAGGGSSSTERTVGYGVAVWGTLAGVACFVVAALLSGAAGEGE